MAKKEKKISVSEFDEVMKTEFDNEGVFEWHGLEVKFVKNISLVSMVEFVQEVVDACVENGAAFEIRDLLVKKNLIERYTNISLPEKLTRVYDIVYGCDITYEIMDHINTEQFNDIETAIINKLRFKLNSNIHNIEKEVEEISARADELMKKFEEVLDELNIEDVKSIASALNTDVFSEQNIIDAFVSRNKSGDNK